MMCRWERVASHTKYEIKTMLKTDRIASNLASIIYSMWSTSTEGEHATYVL